MQEERLMNLGALSDRRERRNRLAIEMESLRDRIKCLLPAYEPVESLDTEALAVLALKLDGMKREQLDPLDREIDIIKRVLGRE